MSLVPLFVLPPYAVAFMWILLDLHTRDIPAKRLRWALVFAVFVVALNIAGFMLLGRSVYTQFYPLFMHLPLLAGFCLLSKYRGWRVLFVFLTTFVSCSIPPLIESGIRLTQSTGFWVDLAVFTLSCLTMLVLAKKVLHEPFSYMLRYGESKDFALFCIIPVLFGLSIYATRGTLAIPTVPFQLSVRTTPLIFTFFSYYLLFHVFKGTREKQIMRNEQDITAARLTAAESELEKLKTVTEQTAEYRHDMRHHLSLIGGYLAEGNTDKIAHYLEQVQSDLDKITPQQFCENETANLVLSSFAQKAKLANISLSANTQIPRSLPLGDTEWCSLLSNLLENAVAACALVHDGRERKIRVVAKATEGEKLLLLVENPYVGEVVLENGVPYTTRQGHGFGLKSVDTVLGRHGGMSLYETGDGLFTARIVI